MPDHSTLLADLSPEKLQRLIDRLKSKATPAPEAQRIPRRPQGPEGEDVAPLSFSQERLWFLDRLEPGTATYNIPLAVALLGDLRPGVLARALRELFRRHEALRTTFEAAEGIPRQRISARATCELPVIDLAALSEAAREGEAERLAEGHARISFDLVAGPLFAAALLRFDRDTHRFLLVLHHIIADGWSLDVLVRELAALYEAFGAGRPSPLQNLPIQYPDFALWQRRTFAATNEQELGYWAEKLEGVEPLELPTDRPRPAVQTYRGGTCSLAFSAELSRRLRDFGRSCEATPFMVLLSLVKALFRRHSGQDDVVVGSPIAGRGKVETEGLIGFFLNTLVLRTDLSGDPGLRELVARVREVTLGAYSHQDVPFEALLARLLPERDLSRTPFFQILFNMLNLPVSEIRQPGLELRVLSIPQTPSKFDMTFYVQDGEEGLRIQLVYNADLFDEERMAGLLGQLTRLAERAVERPEAPLGSLPLVTAASRGMLPDPSEALDAGWIGAVHERFIENARRSPEQTAVEDGDGVWTYADLDTASSRVAGWLQRQGIRRGDCVAVYAHRSAPVVPAVLGALRAGAAFTMLDPAYPAARLAEIFEIAAPRALVCLEAAGPLPAAVAERLVAAGCEVFGLPAGGGGAVLGRLEGCPAGEPVEVGPCDVACIGFTSGSTGRPKGILGLHGSLSHFLPWQCERFGLASEDRFSLLSGLAHDPLQRDLFTPLYLGAAIVVPDPADIGVPGRLAAWIARERVSVAHLTPAMAQLVTEGAADGQAADLRLVLLVGDVLTRLDVARIRALAPRVTCVNLYGSTETQRAVAFHVAGTPEKGAAEAAGKQVLPLGRGMKDVQLLVLNRAGDLAGVGELGEIAVRSPHLALGYLGDEALTADRFQVNPFTGEAGDRIYRTGDLGRYLPNGEVVFAGRSDFQVKIRGYRIELGEIEATLAGLAGVREAIVAAQEDGGEKRLAAFVVPEPGARVGEESLRDALRERLPSYMVPAAFELLPALPITPNGKVDRRALSLRTLRPAAAEDYVAPRNPIEEVLASLWAEVLRLDRVGIDSDFFALGGHSLLVTQLVSRIRAAFDVELPLRALFDRPTVAGLAHLVEEAMRIVGVPVAPPLERVPREGDLPLSFAQQRLWFLDQIEPGSPWYNLSSALRLEGDLDDAALARSLGEILRRHEALRTTFPSVDGRPVQRISPPAAVPLPLVDLTSIPCELLDAELTRRIAGESSRPFDLASGPLLRAVLLRLSEREHVLLLTVHHIAADGWSIGIFVRELSLFYSGFVRNESPSLPHLPVQYADHAAWQRSWLQGETLERLVEAWRTRLSGAPLVLDLPADRPRPPVQTFLGASLPVEIGGFSLRSLRVLARGSGATLFMALLAAFQTLLCRLSGQEDLIVGSPVAGRQRVEVEGLIGVFINTLALRGDLAGQPSFRSVLGRARETALEAYALQELPFEKLVEQLQPERDLSRSPLFQAMLILQNAPVSPLTLPHLELRPLPIESGTARFDLLLSLTEVGEAIAGRLEISTGLFDRSTALRWLRHLEVLIESAVTAPDLPVADLPLLSEAERAQLVREWNDTAAAVPTECLPQLFEAQAKLSPQAPAVIFGDRSLTYGELDRRAGRLARFLRSLGVGPEVIVGVAMERSVEMVVAVLGVLKSGGAYLPLDPSYPSERLAFMLSDSGVAVLLSQEGIAGALPAHGARVLCLDEGWNRDGKDGGGGEALGVLPEPDNLAYVLYTSGSTGQPKGVQVPHRALANFLASMRREPGLGEGDHLLAVTSLSFDIAALELFLPLLVGGCVELAGRDEAADARRLADRLASRRVAAMQATPSSWRMLLDAGWEGRSSLSALCGGEALPPDLAAVLRERTGELWNLYGPTETTVWSAVSRVGEGAVSVGRPIANTSIHLLDRSFRPVPVGAAGELCIGGIGLARGYLGRPDLTADRFVPDPYAEGGCRLYRTGDLARRRADGTLEVLGRLDHQVKLRGFRIELGEIEAVLAGLPQVRQAVVLARDGGGPGDRRLVAYVVPADTGTMVAALRSPLRDRLPDYMVPTDFVFLESLPLTPNGKVDRKALPAPTADRAQAVSVRVPPRNAVEELLAGIWVELLRRERVDIHDDFFELGGHSLLAAQVVSRVRQALGVELPLRSLFEAPTVAGIARAVEEAMREGTRRVSPIVPVPRTGELPLSFSQQRLWFLAQIEPDSNAYNIPMAVRLTGSLHRGALVVALGTIVERHEALRTTFPAVAGEPVQRIASATGDFELPLVDLGVLPQPAEEARRLAAEEALRPFDLAQGPLLRGALLRLGPGEHIALLTLHHIVFDGWSSGVLIRELAALYAAALTGDPSPLPPLPVQYADFAVWQRSQLADELEDALLPFWRGKLAGAPPVLDLPTDRPRSALVGKRRGGLLTRMLDRDVMAALEALGRREGVTLYMILLAAWQVLLYRITGQDDLVTGAPVANRNHADTESLIGFFVNTLALRGRLSPRESFRELAGRVRNELLETYAYQDLPFERLVEELAPERNPGCTPLFQVVLVLQNAPFDELELPELTLAGIGDLPEAGRVPKFDLTVTFSPRGGDLALALELDRNLFDSSTAARLAGWLETLLEALAADPGRAVAELPLLSEIERHELLVDWSGKAMVCPHQATIPELFEAWADLAPEAVAVSFGDVWLSYRALDRQANRLARRLRAMGVGPEVLVGLVAERSLELIVAILAILKAGGAYAPLDPSHPRERLSLLLEDLGAPVALAQQHLAGLLPDNGPRLLLLGSAGAMEESPERLAVRVGPESLAYVMYTSGSTGRPKGVAVVHQGVVRLVRDTGYADFGPQRVWAQLAPTPFDASTLEIWGALLHGGRLAVLPPGTLSPAELGKELSRQGVDSLWLTAGLFHQMVEEGLPGLAAVRQILAGGDVLSPEHVRKALSVLPGCRVINGYGPTENTTFTCCHPMGRPEEVGSPVPLGRPIANTHVWLLDAELHPVPVGVTGELYTGGGGLARGYLHRSELTAERFVPDACSGEPGARLYRTGDWARWRSDGTVEFLGRLDQQVKLRGFRVEPGEVEAALTAHPAVREAAVVVQGERTERRLVAFVAGEVEAGELRRYLELRLPGYMVPSVFVCLAALPLTPNGKVDRRALALLETSEGRPAADLALPRTPVEELLAGMWAEVLRRDAVGIHDDFFALGGHSLLATRLASRIRAVFGVELPLAELFARPTVAGLAEGLEAGLAGESGPQAPPIVPVLRSGEAPLSFAQQRLWLLDQLEPGNPAYNIPLAVRLTGVLDRAALAATLGEIVRRHEPLRTSFPVVAGGPVQRVGAAERFILPWIDLAGLPAGARDGESLRLADEDARRSFNLTEGPLFRPLLVGLASAEHLVLATQHHIASDGWSMEVFLSEVAALYRTCRAGAPSPLPELPVHYADYAVWQRERLQGDFLEAEVAHWRRRLAGAPPALELPADRARPAVWSGRGARESIALPVELSAALRALARCEEVTPFMLLVAGFGSLLARGSGQENLCVGTPIAGRGRLEVEGLIGFFTNTLVLRLGLEGDPGLREILARTRSVALDAYAHEELPFEKLVEELRPERSLAHSPLFQAFFTLQNAPRQAFQLPGLELASLAVESGGAKFDLSLTLTDRGESGYAATLTYASDLFDAATARRLLAGYQALLTALAVNPDVRLSAPALLPAPERHQVLVEWNDTAAEPPAARTLHELFASQAARTPDAVALVWDGETLSYGELDRWANRLAWRLRRAGARPGARVALLAGRSPELVTMTLAALKAGACYVVLDPEQPSVRREQILEDAAPFLLLTREDHLDRLPLFNGEVLFLDPRREPGEPAEALPPLVGPDDLAYVAYTSGSTGRPKGILTPHRGAVGYLCWAVRTHGITAMDTTLQLAAPTFDASVRDTLGPLSVGARVVLVSTATAGDPASLVECMARYEVTCLPSVVPSMLRRLAAEAGSRRAEVPLRLILTSGESLHVADCARVREVFPGVRIVNQYGPTECTMTSTWHLATAAEDGSGAVRIGRPLANARIRLIDRSFEPVPLGARGEICIGGPGLAHGYLGQPDRTAQVFVPDPLAGAEGGRLYRTGDLGRYLPDGTLEFLGRRDNQVKVRGVRVEPGEIEAALVSHPGVASAVVVAFDEAPGDPRLVAYLVVRDDVELPAAGLRAFLRERLPEPMVPAAFVTLDTLPLNVHGKVDRRALPDPGAGDANRALAAPRNRLEETLASLWAEVLRLPRIGIHDSFFELGGHSLSATQLLLRVREELGVDIPLGSVFHDPTVAGLAAAVARRLEPLDSENGSSALGAEEREEIEI